MPKWVRVWEEPREDVQHFAEPPADDTTHEWSGTTMCGLEASLRWVTPENVDANLLCEACAAAPYEPPLEGDHPGPV